MVQEILKRKEELAVMQSFAPAETGPLLPLPPSSFDLPLPAQYIPTALQCYEVIRHFNRQLHLTHYTFEDFLRALIEAEHSVLLNQTHVVLLRALVSAFATGTGSGVLATHTDLMWYALVSSIDCVSVMQYWARPKFCRLSTTMECNISNTTKNQFFCSH